MSVYVVCICVVHALGEVWDSSSDEAKVLRNCVAALNVSHPTLPLPDQNQLPGKNSVVSKFLKRSPLGLPPPAPPFAVDPPVVPVAVAGLVPGGRSRARIAREQNSSMCAWVCGDLEATMVRARAS